MRSRTIVSAFVTLLQAGRTIRFPTISITPSIQLIMNLRAEFHCIGKSISNFYAFDGLIDINGLGSWPSSVSIVIVHNFLIQSELRWRTTVEKYRQAYACFFDTFDRRDRFRFGRLSSIRTSDLSALRQHECSAGPKTGEGCKHLIDFYSFRYLWWTILNTWLSDEIPLSQEIFWRSYHSATRIAVSAALDRSMTFRKSVNPYFTEPNNLHGRTRDCNLSIPAPLPADRHCFRPFSQSLFCIGQRDGRSERFANRTPEEFRLYPSQFSSCHRAHTLAAAPQWGWCIQAEISTPAAFLPEYRRVLCHGDSPAVR